jgi:hypothetical protein
MFKPLHYRAYQQDDPPARNITVAISFGAERELSLEKYEPPNEENQSNKNDENDEDSKDNSTGTSRKCNTPKARLSIPQTNNGVCTIGRNVNIRFEHGITVAEDDDEEQEAPVQPRIGIILWGIVQTDDVDNDKSPPLLPRPRNGKR